MLLGVAGLIAVVGFNLISMFLPLLWLAGGLPRWFSLFVSLLSGLRLGIRQLISLGAPSLWARGIWEIDDRCLQLVPIADALAIGDAVVRRDGHLAWEIWSAAAERALASVFGMAGGPVTPRVSFLVKGRLSSGYVVLVVKK